MGRDRELSELCECIRWMSDGERQVIFVTGEPGIGKTALVDTFQVDADLPDLSVARGQCVDGLGGKEPYYAMLEALGQLARGPRGESVVATLAAQAPTWLVQFLRATSQAEARHHCRADRYAAARRARQEGRRDG